MATQSSILAWRIPWTQEPGGLQFMGSQRVRHDWVMDIHTSLVVLEYLKYCNKISRLSIFFPKDYLILEGGKHKFNKICREKINCIFCKIL